MDGLDAAIAGAWATFLYGAPPAAAARLRSVEGRDGMLLVRVAIEATADDDASDDAVDDLADTVTDDRW